MDRLFIIPHTHYDAVVFKTRTEYLEMGLPIILHALQALRDDPRYRFVLDQVCYIKPFLERYPEQEVLFRKMDRFAEEMFAERNRIAEVDHRIFRSEFGGGDRFETGEGAADGGEGVEGEVAAVLDEDFIQGGKAAGIASLQESEGGVGADLEIA